MHSWSALTRTGALTLLLAAGSCNLEVNIHVADDGVEADVNASTAFTFPELPPDARDRSAPWSGPDLHVDPDALPVPTPPAPPLYDIPSGVSAAVHDALWRPYEAEEAAAELAPADGPTFTPFTRAPQIMNRLEVVRAMERAYPVALKRAGIGGTVRVYFMIDEDGAVLDYRLAQSSGNESLDDAALSVAESYRFSPALNRTEAVPVWVVFPITFQAM